MATRVDTSPVLRATKRCVHACCGLLVYLSRSLSQRTTRASCELNARGSHAQIIQCLLKRSVDLSLVNEDGQGCMHLAAIGGHTPLIKYLHSTGQFDAGAKDSRGRTVLHLAAALGNLDAVTYLVEAAHCEIGCVQGRPRALGSHRGTLTRGRGCAGREVDMDGATCLHLAAAGGHGNVVHFILHSNHRMRLTEEDKEGCTAEDVALRNGYHGIAQEINHVKLARLDALEKVRRCSSSRMGRDAVFDAHVARFSGAIANAAVA
jgi:hypothetical protein